MEVTFSLRQKYFIIANNVFFLLIILLLPLFLRRDIFLITVYGLLYLYLFSTGRKYTFYHLGISTVVALGWAVISNGQYQYNEVALSIFGLNAYILFAWAIGLFVGYLLYAHWQERLKLNTFVKQILFFTAIYWPALIFVESFAYHVLQIQNVTAAVYPGLPLCDCMHGPRWTQASYFVLGPLYFSLCHLFGLEKHYRKHKYPALQDQDISANP